MTAPGATGTVVAVDIGGTKLAVGIVGADGRVRDRRLVPTPRDVDADALFDTLAAAIDDLGDAARARSARSASAAAAR